MAGEDGRRISNNLWLLCALSVIDGMDLQLLPSCFRALEASLGMTPSSLAVLVICQDVAFSVAGPFWGSLADNGYSRKWLLTMGACGWGTLTMMLAFVSDFYTIAALRVMNGACLGMLCPITQSMVAEEAPFAERGYNFGLIDFSNRAIGQLATTMIVTSISNQILFGFEGWRVAFFCVALMSLVLALLVVCCFEERPREFNGDNVNIMAELTKFVAYFKIPTFTVVVVQGMVGTIPGAAMQFAAMYFQYLGLPDAKAATICSMMVLGGGFGALLGGMIGDKMASTSPEHGRPLTAQASVFLGIPFVYLVFSTHPPRHLALMTFGLLMFMLGLVSSWCATGCNKPIFLQIVPEGSRASAMAWEFCIEHTFGHLIGPISVAFISQHFFGYESSRAQVVNMPPQLRKENADALGKSLTISTVFPWIVCFLIYGFLHFTYKYDIRPDPLIDRDEQSTSKERKSDESYNGNPNEVP